MFSKNEIQYKKTEGVLRGMNYQNNSAQSELGALDVSLNLDGNVEVCTQKISTNRFTNYNPTVYQANWPGTTAAR